jgi:hypothetical protein
MSRTSGRRFHFWLVPTTAPHVTKFISTLPRMCCRPSVSSFSPLVSGGRLLLGMREIITARSPNTLVITT